MGLLSRASHGAIWAPNLGGQVRVGNPIEPIDLSTPPQLIGGLPFAPRWFGDVFPQNRLPFHQCESCEPPNEPDEFVDVAVVGGGLSGLASAWMLRDAQPVVFDLRRRFGGNAMGESWEGVPYSMGSAYFIVPDRGSSLEALYRELGVLADARIDKGPLAFEWNHRITEDPCIGGCTPAERDAARAYQRRVWYFAYDKYPDIPVPPRDLAWISSLDQVPLRDDIQAACGALPVALAEAVQAYCYSSFGVGWDQISAAAGWNFIAAEEFGRVVLPGGNSSLASRLWSKLADRERSGQEPRLRPGAMVESVHVEDDRVLVRWRTAQGVRRTLSAKHVIMANAKHLVERMVDDLATLDPDKANAIPLVQTAAYLVANVLLRRPADVDLYDTFLLHDAGFPMDPTAAERERRIVDVVDGTFTRPSNARDVLTLYWPLPFASARFTIVQDTDWQTYAELGAPQIRRALGDLGISTQDVAEIRLTRWGHAMPIAAPGAIANGTAELVRRPIAEKLWFVNQDNWLLPAVETCLLEAETYTAEIARRL